MNDLESTVRARLHDLAAELPEEDAGERARTARAQHQRQRRNRMSVLAVCAGLLVIAGGSTAAGALLSSAPEGGVVTGPPEVTGTAPGTSAPATGSTQAPPSPSPSPSPSAAARPSASPAPATGAPRSSAPRSTAPAGSASTGSAPATPPAGTPGAWPAEATSVQGGVYWAVFLDVSRAGDTSGEQEALAALSDLGYQGGVGDVACSQGAAAALGLDPSLSYTGVSVYFGTAADAQRFVDLYQPGVVGTARITAYCLD